MWHQSKHQKRDIFNNLSVVKQRVTLQSKWSIPLASATSCHCKMAESVQNSSILMLIFLFKILVHSFYRKEYFINFIKLGLHVSSSTLPSSFLADE